MQTGLDFIINNYPNQNAIWSDGKFVTYGQLGKMINQFALALQKIITKPAPIAFCTKRGINAVICMCGIMKSGCYYVPIDPTYPKGRIDHIIQDIKPSFIISDSTIEFENQTIINVDDLLNQTCPDSHKIKSFDNELAYIIYTSGSTGVPKGVMIKQSSLLNLVKSEIKKCGINFGSRVLHYTSIGFDAAGWDIYGSLLSGSTLYVVPDSYVYDPPQLHQFMKDHMISFATLTPSYLAQMPFEPIPSLKHMIIMGEHPDIKLLNWWSKHTNVYNGYGPTECTIGSTIHLFKVGDCVNNIGQPFDNYQVYILDENLNNVPDGEVGEICVGGEGLAVGYHNLPKVTEKKFIMTKMGRLYRTGDLGSIQITGIEIHGRIDNQIKINGIRIELEEIESLAKRLESIKDAKAIFHNKHIYLFYQQSKIIKISEIRSFLSEHLHRTVVPFMYIQLDQFPINAHGKVDKSKLVDLIDKTTSTQSGNLDSSQRLIANVFSNVLNLDVGLLGPDSNYYEMGGTSLDIHKVVKMLHENGINISVQTLMNNPTIYQIAFIAKSISAISKPSQFNPTDSFPLTPIQSALLTYHELYPNSIAYSTIKFYEFGTIGIEKVVDLFKKICSTHPALRTRYVKNKNKYEQKFDFEPEIKIIDVTSKDDAIGFASNDFYIPFNLNNPMIRISVYNNLNGEIFVSVIKDGTISDALSENIIDINIEKIKNNEEVDPDYYPILLSEFCEMFKTQDLKFWDMYLADPSHHLIPQYINNKSSHLVYSIRSPITKIATSSSTTPFVIASCALALMLKTFILSDNVIFGTQIAHRDKIDFMSCVGFLVSTVLFRIKIVPDLKELIKQVHKSYVQIYQNKSVTYDYLVSKWGRSIDLMFVFREGCNSDIDIKSDSPPPFPITFYLYVNGDDLTLDIKTSYESGLINAMCNSFKKVLKDFESKILDNIVNSPDQCLIGPSIPIDHSIGSMFDKICEKYPSNVALSYSSETGSYLDLHLTYSELQKMIDNCANKLLLVYNLEPGTVVGLNFNKSKEFIILVLAIWKIGCAYVPIDPSNPVDRNIYIINNCGTKLVFYKTKSIISSLDDIDDVVFVEVTNFIDMELPNSANCELPHINQSDLAYIIYTSGSTGNPKGCKIRQNSILNVCDFFRNELNLNPNQSVWTQTTISFDIVVLEMFLPLITGAELMICPPCIASDLVVHTNWINYHKPSIIQGTPTLFSIIGDHLKSNPNMTILVGGEALNSNVCEKLLKISPNIYNVYGPTETTIWSTIKKINSHGYITIGRPISNTRCYVMDENMNPVPEYVTGELCISGIGVLIGYVGLPEVSSKKFGVYQGHVMYRTGDLVKVIHNEIVYVGRTDFQVKIRGHRLEIEGIVKIIESYKGITRAVVKVIDDTIVGYYVGQPNIEISNDDVFSFLREKMPKYSVPNFLIKLPRFPETLNGKINLKELPLPNQTGGIRYKNVVKIKKPQNDLESQICDMLSKLLNIDDISVDESWLNIGFTSIHVAKFSYQLGERYNVEISAIDLVQNSTIEKCANLIEKMLDS